MASPERSHSFTTFHNISQLEMLISSQQSAYSAHLSWDPSGDSCSFCSLPSACNRSANLSIFHNTSLAETWLCAHVGTYWLMATNSCWLTHFATYYIDNNHSALSIAQSCASKQHQQIYCLLSYCVSSFCCATPGALFLKCVRMLSSIKQPKPPGLA